MKFLFILFFSFGLLVQTAHAEEAEIDSAYLGLKDQLENTKRPLEEALQSALGDNLPASVDQVPKNLKPTYNLWKNLDEAKARIEKVYSDSNLKPAEKLKQLRDERKQFDADYGKLDLSPTGGKTNDSQDQGGIIGRLSDLEPKQDEKQPAQEKSSSSSKMREKLGQVETAGDAAKLGGAAAQGHEILKESPGSHDTKTFRGAGKARDIGSKAGDAAKAGQAITNLAQDKPLDAARNLAELGADAASATRLKDPAGVVLEPVARAAGEAVKQTAEAMDKTTNQFEDTMKGALNPREEAKRQQDIENQLRGIPNEAFAAATGIDVEATKAKAAEKMSWIKHKLYDWAPWALSDPDKNRIHLERRQELDRKAIEEAVGSDEDARAANERIAEYERQMREAEERLKKYEQPEETKK